MLGIVACCFLCLLVVCLWVCWLVRFRCLLVISFTLCCYSCLLQFLIVWFDGLLVGGVLVVEFGVGDLC